MKRCINIFFNSILAAIVIYIVLLAISSYNRRSNLEYVSGIGSFKFMHMITGSMEPGINIGDVIITKAVGAEDLKEGDIITFRTSGNILVTHRIMGINGDGRFITKGDANANEDMGLEVNKDNIIGKYILKIPKGAYIAEFFKSFIGMLLFLLFMILLLKSNVKHIMNRVLSKVDISP